MTPQFCAQQMFWWLFKNLIGLVYHGPWSQSYNFNISTRFSPTVNYCNLMLLLGSHYYLSTISQNITLSSHSLCYETHPHTHLVTYHKQSAHHGHPLVKSRAAQVSAPKHFLCAVRCSIPLVSRTDASASLMSLDKKCPELPFPGSMVASDHSDSELGRLWLSAVENLSPPRGRCGVQDFS